MVTFSIEMFVFSLLLRIFVETEASPDCTDGSDSREKRNTRINNPYANVFKTTFQPLFLIFLSS
jgi:hypothetical protein